MGWVFGPAQGALFSSLVVDRMAIKLKYSNTLKIHAEDIIQFNIKQMFSGHLIKNKIKIYLCIKQPCQHLYQILTKISLVSWIGAEQITFLSQCSRRTFEIFLEKLYFSITNTIKGVGKIHKIYLIDLHYRFSLHALFNTLGG